MSKKRRTLLIVVVLIVPIYVLWQWTTLKVTDKVPFCNLLNQQNENCMIYFNINHQGKNYPIVYPYFFAVERFTSPEFRFLAPFYFNEVIKYDLSITVDDSTFSEIGFRVVDPAIINVYYNRKLVSDTTVVTSDNIINRNIRGEHRKAVIYCLLKQGVNCCLDHSGDVFVTSASSN